MKDDFRIPVYSNDNPGLKDIMKICSGRISQNFICVKRQFRVKQTSTFVVDLVRAKVLHPYDLDSDDCGLRMEKKENMR